MPTGFLLVPRLEMVITGPVLYPIPALVKVIEVTTPAVILAVAVACVPSSCVVSFPPRKLVLTNCSKDLVPPPGGSS